MAQLHPAKTNNINLSPLTKDNMTQEDKKTAAKKYASSWMGTQDTAERSFMDGMTHAESTHSKDIGELVKALESTTKILNDYYKGYAPESDAHKQIFINLPLIQKHSSNT